MHIYLFMIGQEEFKGENKTGQTGMIYKDQAKSISEKLKLKSYESNYKVVLIWCGRANE